MIERIYTHPVSRGPQVEHQSVRIVAGMGIQGDRYFGKKKSPGQNITFVEAEEIESFLSEYGRAHELSVTRRNVITRGVRLNELVGKEFVVGGLRFRGVEVCEPCRGLGASLASPELGSAKIVRRLVHRAGLRADALSSGELALGMRFASAF